MVHCTSISFHNNSQKPKKIYCELPHTSAPDANNLSTLQCCDMLVGWQAEHVLLKQPILRKTFGMSSSKMSGSHKVSSKIQTISKYRSTKSPTVKTLFQCDSNSCGSKISKFNLQWLAADVPDYKYGKPGSEKHLSQPTLPTNHTLQYCSKYGVPEKTQISPTFVNPMLHLISCRNKKVLNFL